MIFRSLYGIAILTIVTFIGLGLALLFLFQPENSLQGIIFGGKPIYFQLGFGAFYGFLAAKSALLLLSQPFMEDSNTQYTLLFKQLKLTIPSILVASLAAGLGEEFFFRAVLQEWLGPIFTSILFVAIHGYLNPMNWRISIYGVFMTIVIAFMAHMYMHVGFWFAVTVHTVIDIVLFLDIKKQLKL